MEVKVGDIFDPATMEAMTEIESDLPHGAVVEEIEPGYRLHEKVLRAAGDNQQREMNFYKRTNKK